jgi:type VI secretion system secreted protein Hcp
MPSDIFAKVGDINGESIDDKHKDEIEVQSYSWGVTNSGSMGAGTGGGAGKADFHDLTFVHNYDKASPILMQACTTGVHMKEATIFNRKAGKGQQEYLTIKMSDVIVTSVTHGASADTSHVENVGLSFAKVAIEYKPQKPDGTLDAAVKFAYDRLGQKEL